MFDLKDALRSVVRDPLYSVISILTLALTIGATTAVFSIVDGVLLKPLAYRESHQLVELRERWEQLADRPTGIEVNEQHFNYWRMHQRSFDSMAQYLQWPTNLTGAGEPVRIIAAHTSGTLFDVLQIGAALGRTLQQKDEDPGQTAVVAVSDALWRRRLNADPSIVGRSIVLDGKPFTVVGVLPPGFRLPYAGRLLDDVDAYVPLPGDVERQSWVGDHNDMALARLKAGVSIEQARAELQTLEAQVSRLASDEAHEPVTLRPVVVPLTDAIVGESRRGLLLLLAAIGAVLLIACSNLANLSLTRTIARGREAALRAALGASSGRLVTHAIIEQIILSICGGLAGLGVAAAALRLFVKTAPLDLPRVDQIALDGGVVAFTAAVSIAAGLIVAVMPAWRVARHDVSDALRRAGTATTSDRGGLRARSALLALQVALAVMLLVVTALLTVSFVKVMAVDRGFQPERVLSMQIVLPENRYATEPSRLAAYDRVVAAVEALPGIVDVSTTSMLPLTGEGQVNFVAVEGERRPRSEQPTANFRFVAPDYFRTLGIAMQRGRMFTNDEREPNRPAPVVVSASTAARLWPGQDALGKRFSRAEPSEQGFEIVGIVPDTRLTSLERTPPLMVFVPYWWRSRPATYLVMKTAAPPATFTGDVRRAIWKVDPEIAIGDSRPLDEIVDEAFASRRYQMHLFVAFGAAALLIAAIGVYAATAYGISRRRREMNIRVALGAQAREVMQLAVRQTFSPVLTGLALGAAGAAALGTIVATLLFGVQARDPLIIATVVAIVGGTGLAACLTAARQNLAIDPARALRDD